MKYYIITLLLFLSLKGWSQHKNYIDQPYLETAASVDTLVTPDRIYLNIMLLEKDTKGKISVEELESQMERTLQRIGINTNEHLTLNDLASNFKNYLLKPQDILKSKSYTLMVEDANTAGEVIAELENIEISNVFLDRTEFSRIEHLKLELKSKAIKKAKKQAEYMTEPLGQALGPAIYITDQSGSMDNYAIQGQASGITARGLAEVVATGYGLNQIDLNFKKIKVEASVNVIFKIQE